MKILIAEDDPVSRRMLEGILSKAGYEVVATEDGKRALDLLLHKGAPRLALLDWMMPGCDGPCVCRAARKRTGRPYVYIVLLTSKEAKADVIVGLESGADDYLTKPFDPEELKARLRAGLRILHLEDSLTAAREEMQYKATHDQLTGLWNRAAVLEMLERELARARREGTSVAVLLADLDHFKDVNDTHGHLAGDEVLREVGRRMRNAVRSYDIVGRYGGEEFLILMPGCDARYTRDRAEQLRTAVCCGPVKTKTAEIRFTMSAGALASADWPGAGVEDLLRMADAALYRAKESGRNRAELVIPATLSGVVLSLSGVGRESGKPPRR